MNETDLEPKQSPTRLNWQAWLALAWALGWALAYLLMVMPARAGKLVKIWSALRK